MANTLRNFCISFREEIWLGIFWNYNDCLNCVCVSLENFLGTYIQGQAGWTHGELMDSYLHWLFSPWIPECLAQAHTSYFSFFPQTLFLVQFFLRTKAQKSRQNRFCDKQRLWQQNRFCNKTAGIVTKQTCPHISPRDRFFSIFAMWRHFSNWQFVMWRNFST